jgi:hypothetical protein
MVRLAQQADPATQEAFDRLPPPADDDWPTLDDTALHGIAGEIVRAIAPHTEADPAALLITALTMAGASIGRGPHALADGAQHPGRLWTLIVGNTAKARKGTSLKQVRRVFERADPTFVRDRILGGFSSGEAVIDAVSTNEPGADHRLLVVEPEYARVLAVCRREGVTLSPIMRDGWDGERLQVRTRNRTHGTAVADGAHVAMLGHITTEELRAKLDETEQANGYANRHLFILARRAQLLPAGGNLDDAVVHELGSRLRRTLDRARKRGILHRSDAADEAWDRLYRELADDDCGGMLGALTARSEAQCLRLSVLYALLDEAPAIEVVHIEAARAVWDYCAHSIRVIFGDKVGDEVADRILELAEAAGDVGVGFDEIQQHFSRHLTARRRDVAVQLLSDQGRIVVRQEGTAGRSRTVVYLATEAM